ncbi:Mitochondrial glutamate carrier 2 [Trichinella britovi]|uniref:Mitochondrial glutamate carrier 2 n=1 Tax=Trichinella britovi TaxID=45882 RepID=A0A0V1D264_TRIBR|nr:Mitochondrial glutamate carrier 2 [Trichinella britovi]
MINKCYTNTATVLPSCLVLSIVTPWIIVNHLLKPINMPVKEGTVSGADGVMAMNKHDVTPAGPKMKRSFQLLPKIINGGIAGIIGVTCVFPIDLVKTRLQNQKIIPGGEPMYRGMLDCFRKSVARGGFFGMYSGSGVNILLITPEKAIKLAANDFFRYHLSSGSGKLSLVKELVAGAGAGFCQIAVTTPMELLKIHKNRLSATKIALNILRTKGISGLYKGTAATMARDVTFSAIYFPLFANLNSKGPRKKDGSGEAVFWHSFICGNIAGATASFAVTPLDVIKTRLQLLQQSNSITPQYRGIVDAFRRILYEEGVTAFFKGAACRMAVVAPLFGIAQTIYYIGVAEWLLS